MGIGISVFLIAVGAILTWAVHVSVSGVDLRVLGVILMVVGAIGLLWSLIVFGTRDRTIVDGGSSRTVVRDVPRERVIERDY
jgi:hypothetical protein